MWWVKEAQGGPDCHGVPGYRLEGGRGSLGSPQWKEQPGRGPGVLEERPAGWSRVGDGGAAGGEVWGTR